MNHHNDDMQPEPWVLPHMQPKGLDQQGRWPTHQPMAAEACNDTDDDEPDFAPAARFWTLYLAALLVALAAGMAWLG